MSYSIGITADTKDEAVAKVGAEFDRIVEGQPAHAADADAAKQAASAFIAVLVDPGETECVRVDMYGSLSWRDENVFTSANVSVTAYLAQKS